MPGQRGSRTSAAGALAAALAAVTAGTAGHALAAGCLPSARSLLLALPLSVVAVLAVSAALRGRAATSLAAGQLAVHAVLAGAAACTGSHAHTGTAHLLSADGAMLLAHVGALAACRAASDRLQRTAEHAVALLVPVVAAVVHAVAAVLRRPLEVPPPAVHPRALTTAGPRPLASRPRLLAAPRRGPPGRRAPARPLSPA